MDTEEREESSKKGVGLKLLSVKIAFPSPLMSHAKPTGEWNECCKPHL